MIGRADRDSWRRLSARSVRRGKAERPAGCEAGRLCVDACPGPAAQDQTRNSCSPLKDAQPEGAGGAGGFAGTQHARRVLGCVPGSVPIGGRPLTQANPRFSGDSAELQSRCQLPYTAACAEQGIHRYLAAGLPDATSPPTTLTCPKLTLLLPRVANKRVHRDHERRA